MATAFSYRNKGSHSSDSDSEDSGKECLNWKRVTKNNGKDLEKIPIAPPPVELQPAQPTNNLKRKRNTIWTEVLEDQMMSETLQFCGIKNKPKGFGSRGEESYDFTAGKNDYNDDGSDEIMSDESKTFYSHSYKRFKSYKYVDVDDAGKEVAKKIVRILAEKKAYLIYRTVKYLGTEKALKLLKMTEDIEESGGIMIKNQERRRTPGGVYLHLLRSDNTVDKKIMDKIFEDELNSFEQKKKFDILRKKKKSRKYERKKKTKDQMEVQNSSPDNSKDSNSKDSDVGSMEEEDVFVDDTPDPIVKQPAPPLDIVANERTSDLEEGEVE